MPEPTAHPAADPGVQSDLRGDPMLRDVPFLHGHRVLQPYVIYQFVAEGGMGRVYRAWHMGLEVDAALKFVRSGTGLSSCEAEERFRREKQIGAEISSEHLVHVRNADMRHGLLFLEMEWVEGETALARLERLRRLPVADVLAVARGTAQALRLLHGAGVVHRDVKPQNVMLAKDGVVKLADLGLVRRLAEDGRTRTGAGMGTPGYLPPEQALDAGSVGPEADVYSLGASCYELLTGALPERSFLCHDEFPRLRDCGLDLPRPLAEVVDRCTSLDPQARYADGQELFAALDRVAAELGLENIDRLDGVGSQRPDGAASTRPTDAVLRAIVEDAVTHEDQVGSQQGAATVTSKSAPRRALLVPAALLGVSALAWGLWPERSGEEEPGAGGPSMARAVGRRDPIQRVEPPLPAPPSPVTVRLVDAGPRRSSDERPLRVLVGCDGQPELLVDGEPATLAAVAGEVGAWQLDLTPKGTVGGTWRYTIQAAQPDRRVTPAELVVVLDDDAPVLHQRVADRRVEIEDTVRWSTAEVDFRAERDVELRFGADETLAVLELAGVGGVRSLPLSADGRAVLVPLGKLGEGLHEFQVRARDVAGNEEQLQLTVEVPCRYPPRQPLVRVRDASGRESPLYAFALDAERGWIEAAVRRRAAEVLRFVVVDAGLLVAETELTRGQFLTFLQDRQAWREHAGRWWPKHRWGGDSLDSRRAAILRSYGAAAAPTASLPAGGLFVGEYLAYCAWLSEVTQREVSLPTAQEWLRIGARSCGAGPERSLVGELPCTPAELRAANLRHAVEPSPVPDGPDQDFVLSSGQRPWAVFRGEAQGLLQLRHLIGNVGELCLDAAVELAPGVAWRGRVLGGGCESAAEEVFLVPESGTHPVWTSTHEPVREEGVRLVIRI